MSQFQLQNFLLLRTEAQSQISQSLVSRNSFWKMNPDISLPLEMNSTFKNFEQKLSILWISLFRRLSNKSSSKTLSSQMKWKKTWRKLRKWTKFCKKKQELSTEESTDKLQIFRQLWMNFKKISNNFYKTSNSFDKKPCFQKNQYQELKKTSQFRLGVSYRIFMIESMCHLWGITGQESEM